tara:strand:- start:104 stop:253 length:150 start_codon:yes stop_codon:yes gene_type:complete
MTNSWALLAMVLDGTLDETFPIINEKEKSKSRKSHLSGERYDNDSDIKH